ncbi:MAG: signal peptidase II [Catenulispora sp.]
MASEVRAGSEAAESWSQPTGSAPDDRSAEASEVGRSDADLSAEPDAPVEAVESDAPAARKPRRVPVLIGIAALALTIDVVSKLLVVQHLEDRAPIRLFGGAMYLNLYRNSGAAFSIGEGQTWVFTVIAAAVVFVILRVSRNLRSLPWACALGLLLGGALGNLSDRIFRAPGLFRGHVVDFLQFHTFPVVNYDFPVFNLADSAIVTGGCLMVLLSFLGVQPDGTRHRDREV